MTNKPAQRVLFHGVTGSGKSSAANAYAQAAGLEEYSADDDIGWLPGWQQGPVEEQRRINTETLRRMFARDSIIVWHFTSFGPKREPMARMQADADLPPVIRFRRPCDLERSIADTTSCP